MAYRYFIIGCLALLFLVSPNPAPASAWDQATSRARYLNPNTGRFWTMDSYEGNNLSPLSLHKYLYCMGNSVGNTDPSGHDVGEMLSIGSIMGSLFAMNSPSIKSANSAVSIGSTAGPDISTALLNTIIDVEHAFMPPSQTVSIAANVAATFMTHLNTMRTDGWDILPLNSLGHRGAPDFGNGAILGTGLGRETVQFGMAGQPLRVYYGGSVNYVLWGKVFRMLYEFTRNPLSGAHDMTWSESSALTSAWLHKFGNGDETDDYRKEALAFVKFGFDGTDPSSTALPLKANAKNLGASSILPWKWFGLH